MSVDGWEPRSLLALADYINGYAFKPDDWGKEGLPIIRIEQLKNPDGPADYYAGQLPSAVVIDDGDLIFSWSASLFLRIWTHGPATLNQHLFKVIERDGVDRLFLKAFIEYYLPHLTRASHGSTMQHITRKELERFVAPFPTNEHEQAKIAEVLSMIDRAIEETEALIAKQQRIKTGLIQDLLNCGIDEHGNLRSEQTHEFKDSALGRMPAEWDVAGLSTRKHAKKPYLKTGPFGSSLKISDWVEHGIPVITIGALGEGSFEESDLLHISMAKAEQLTAYALEPGDIVFSRVADVGRSVVVTERERDWIMSSNMMRISIDVTKADPNFLRLNIVKHPGVRAQIRQTVNAGGREVANQQVLDALRFPWPTVNEQRRIVRAVAQQSEQIVRKEACLAKFRYVKAGLMHDLLTGKRRVTALIEQREEVTT